VGAALLMGAAVCVMHYTGMSAIRVQLAPETTTIEGVGPFALLMPISILACVVITALAYATVGLSVQRENEQEDGAADQRAARLAARPQSAAMLRPRLTRHH
jgi:hypothetical protein